MELFLFTVMCKIFTVIPFIVLDLWVTKVGKLDVCKWRVFESQSHRYYFCICSIQGCRDVIFDFLQQQMLIVGIIGIIFSIFGVSSYLVN